MPNSSLTPILRFPGFFGEWESKKISELVTNVGGTSLEEFVDSNSSYKFVSIGNYTKSGIYNDDGKRIVLNDKTKTKLLDKNNLVMVLNDKTANGDIIGSTILIDKDITYIYNQRSERLIVNDGISPLFLWIYFNSKLFRKRVIQQSQGGTQIYVNFPTVKKMQILLPAFPEQQIIASFLEKTDSWIENLKQQKIELEKYKKGMMQKIFAQEIRFKDEKGKDFPEWENKKLIDYPDLESGDGDWILSEDISENGKYKIVQLGNIGFGNYIDKKLKTISEDKFKELNGTPIQKGDLLINRMVDNRFYCCIFDKTGDYITSVDVCWIRKNKFFNNYFLMSLISLKKNQNRLLNLSSGSGRVRISKNNLFNEFVFKIPSLFEQKRIVSFLTSIDKVIQSKQLQIFQAEKYKKGLMQGLFI